MQTETLTLKVDKSKKKAFLEFLQLLDFVSVESDEEFLKRFIKNAPKNVPLSDEDIVNEVTAVRNKRRSR
jgi:hypothetical protein